VSDIVKDAKEWLDEQPKRTQTHSENCHKWHSSCLVYRLLSEIALLRESLAIFVHAHATGNSVPPKIEAAAKALLKEVQHD
jgi:hypothetical protein